MLLLTVIPLSKRFNAEKRDVRFSRADEYNYDALIRKPDISYTDLDGTLLSNINSMSRDDIVKQGMQNARIYGRETGKGGIAVYVPDVQREVVVNPRALRHGLDRRFKNNAAATCKAGEILKNSIKINELIPRNIETESTYLLLGAARSASGQRYIVTFTVNHNTNDVTDMDILYAENAKKEPAAFNTPAVPQSGSLTDSSIKVSELLDIVNSVSPDILTEDVLKHFGHTSRPDGKLGRSALFSRADVSEDSFEAKYKESQRALKAAEREKAHAIEQVTYWAEQMKVRPGKKASALSQCHERDVREGHFPQGALRSPHTGQLRRAAQSATVWVYERPSQQEKVDH